jgi:hypothetical protein
MAQLKAQGDQRVAHLARRFDDTSAWQIVNMTVDGQVGYIPTGRHPIGRTQGIFPLADILLVAHRVYSHWQTSCWSHTGYISTGRHHIGRTQGIFPLADIILVAHRVYSQWLTSYWSFLGHILVCSQ